MIEAPQQASSGKVADAAKPDCLLEWVPEEIEARLEETGLPGYRARQILQWVCRRGVLDWEKMSDLPAAFRSRIEAQWSTVAADVAEVHRGKEASKYLFRLQDGLLIEGVLLEGGTLCISSQVGCLVGCPFCASGRGGLQRNLSPGEILSQVALMLPPGYTSWRVVVMGMGEPFHNYQAVMAALATLRHPSAWALGARHITVSTLGVVPEIYRFAGEAGEINLAVSLHAPDDALRRRIVPLAEAYSLEQLFRALDYYAQRTGRRPSYEYVLLRGVNDGPAQAKALVRLLHGRLAHVNLLPYNPVPGLRFQAPSRDGVQRFRNILREGGISTTVRRSLGTDIAAACGQLAGGSVWER